LHFSITDYGFTALSMLASMRGVYLISAADHTSVKCRRHPTVPSCASQPRTCAVDGDGVGTRIDAKRIRAPSPAGRERNRVSMALTLIT